MRGRQSRNSHISEKVEEDRFEAIVNAAQADPERVIREVLDR